MGAFRITVTLHDEELIRFARAALADDALEVLGPDAAYVGARIAQQVPDLMAAIERGELT